MPGRHMAMNALAALGALLALGMSPEKGKARIASFPPVAGRGARHNTVFENKNITIIDESYNANPASMQETLFAFSEEQHDKPSRVLILGDMLELGDGSAEYHRALKEYVRKVDPDRVLLCGNEMRNLWNVISEEYSGHWYADENALIKDIPHWIKDNDVLFVKGSHGTGLHKLTARFTS
jgi:UDP-N-acetylmuramyl pentapeptide synthase